MQASQYIDAVRLMTEVRRTCDDTLLGDADVLALPTTIIPAVPIDEAQKDDPTLGLTRLTGAFNLTGQPAMSVPCGLTPHGLPIGLQLVGRRFDETTVLRVAHAFEVKAGVSMLLPPA
jgi:Asp-tRNA(Asn)/Glu-tRNA(Gln) amidotransferase A subunit family amidase